MPIPTLHQPTGFDPNNKESLTMYLTGVINELQFILTKLDHQNINRLNYIPLLSDASLGSATPQAGWVRAIQSSGITNLQYYSTAWITLMKFSTSYQTNLAGAHDHTVSVGNHTHTFSGTDSAGDTFSGVTGSAGAFSTNTASTGLHFHTLITT